MQGCIATYWQTGERPPAAQRALKGETVGLKNSRCIWVGVRDPHKEQGKPLRTGDTQAGLWKSRMLTVQKLWEDSIKSVCFISTKSRPGINEDNLMDFGYLKFQSHDPGLYKLSPSICIGSQLTNEALLLRLFNLISMKALGGRLGEHHCSHCTEEEIEAPTD